MPTPTYFPLANITLGTTTSAVSFSSIPASFRDLILVMNHKVNTPAGTNNWTMTFNSDTGSNYSYVRMYGNGANSFSNSGSGLTSIANFLDPTASFTNNVFQIMDYSATDKHKTILARENLTTEQVIAKSHRWASTAAITSITLTGPDSGTDLFSVGSTFALYAITSTL
jgi:hypothetical protein